MKYIYLCWLMIAFLGCEEQQPDEGSLSEQILGSWRSMGQKNPHITDGYTVDVEMTLTFYRTRDLQYFDLVTDISYTSTDGVVNNAKIISNGGYEVSGDIILFDPWNYTVRPPTALVFLAETSILDELNAEMIDKVSKAELSGDILTIDGKRWQRVH